MELLTFKDAHKIKQPIVYGLCCSSDCIIKYVGQTINPSKRMQSYFYPRKRGNRNLKRWLYDTDDNLRFIILELNPKHLSDAELYWIHKLHMQTFNIDMGDGIRKPDEKMPWSAGLGARCPSDLLMFHLRNRKYPGNTVEKVKRIRKKMTMRNRILFELRLAKDYENHYHFGRSINKWLDIVSCDILNGVKYGC